MITAPGSQDPGGGAQSQPVRAVSQSVRPKAAPIFFVRILSVHNDLAPLDVPISFQRNGARNRLIDSDRDMVRLDGSFGIDIVRFTCIIILTSSRDQPMRDDLHKSVPQSRAWTKVLRLACTHADAHDIQDALVRAIRKDADWLTEGWGQKFQAVLELGRDELFAQEKVREALILLANSSPNPHARASCEIALGILVREGDVPSDFKTSVVDKALRTFADDCIEHVASLVAKRFDGGQAAQVSRFLRSHLPSCDLTRDPPKRERNVGRSVDSALGIPLEISL